MTINRTFGLEAALEAWDSPTHSLNKISLDLNFSNHLSIAKANRSGASEGVMVTPHHPSFLDAIEPGVQELVCALVGKGFVTYTSCEGHALSGEREPVERNVGLVARTRDEFLALTKLLLAVAETANQAHEGRAARAACRHLPLQGDQRAFLAVEMWFDREEGYDWNTYFTDLEPVYQAVLHSIRTA